LMLKKYVMFDGECMLNKVKKFLKKEIVFTVSLVCALCTVFFVPFDKEYMGYIDLRVLCLLFSLMAVVAGFKNIGVFRFLTSQILSKIKNDRILGITLVLLPFFSSMLVTNDVALIVFVPFTIALLSELGCTRSIVPVIVLQTVSANLGSAATPIGNPQNLYIYSKYNLSPDEFFSVILPICLISLVLLIFCSAFAIPPVFTDKIYEKESIDSKKSLLIYFVLFILCLLTVFDVMNYLVTTVVVIAVLLFSDFKILKDVDYILLLTFVCFFVISGNLARVDVVSDFLQKLLTENSLLTAVGASQIISNVPAAVLLSGFTDNWKDLLLGVNIGGLGTPVASLASLISLKFYMKSENPEALKFLLMFSIVNIAFLAVLLIFNI